jgi:hypothetical protein
MKQVINEKTVELVHGETQRPKEKDNKTKI